MDVTGSHRDLDILQGAFYAKISALGYDGEQRHSKPQTVLHFLSEALMTLMLNDPCNAPTPLSRH